MAERDLLGAAAAPPAILPWQHETWSRLTRDLARLPHALLLHGPAGLGKSEFARALAQSLLCRAPGAEGTACGRCKSCMLFAAGNHPDALFVSPLEDSQVITVDQIRAVGEYIALMPHTASRKAVVLDPAEAMNLSAANSLLKVLEEPPGGSFLVLVADQHTRLPVTIRSRCVRIAFAAPADAESQVWLGGQGIDPGQAVLLTRHSGGAPLRARALHADGFLARCGEWSSDLEQLAAGRLTPTAVATRWKAGGSGAALAWLQQWLCDLARLGVAGGEARLANADLVPRLRQLLKHLDLKDLYDLYDAVSDARNQLRGPLDEQLLLEDLLIRWARCLRPGNPT